jgi:MOSC domain-containing protein YiiM
MRRLNVDGDAQGDLSGHGGQHRAVLVSQTDSYHYWERELKRNDFTFGQFGENFTVEGLADDDVSIGDRFRIGTAVFEVTQPRVTCYRVGIRMGVPALAALLVSHHRPGFYLRFLQELAPKCPQSSIAWHVMQKRKNPQLLTVVGLNVHGPETIRTSDLVLIRDAL